MNNQMQQNHPLKEQHNYLQPNRGDAPDILSSFRAPLNARANDNTSHQFAPPTMTYDLPNNSYGIPHMKPSTTHMEQQYNQIPQVNHQMDANHWMFSSHPQQSYQPSAPQQSHYSSQQQPLFGDHHQAMNMGGQQGYQQHLPSQPNYKSNLNKFKQLQNKVNLSEASSSAASPSYTYDNAKNITSSVSSVSPSSTVSQSRKAKSPIMKPKPNIKIGKDGSIKIKRSRMGCLVCRQRKKRCCETRPVCYECKRLSLNCTWPIPGSEHKNRPRHSRNENEGMHFDPYFGNIKILRGIVESS